MIIKVIKSFGISSARFGPPKGSITSNMWIQKRFPTYSPPYIPIFERRLINIKPPRTLPDEDIRWEFKRFYKKEMPEIFVLKISNGRVWGSKGTIITDDDYLLTDLSRDWLRNMYKNQHSVLRQIYLGKLKELKGNVAVVATAGADNYYHWMFDILTRFGILKIAGILNDMDHFILPPLSFLKKIFIDTELPGITKRLGIPFEKLIFSDSPSFHVQAEQLFVPSLPSLIGAQDKWACEFIRNLYLDNRHETTRHSKYIYLARRIPSNKRLFNEQEILTFLEPLGFEVVECEKLSIAEQAEIFNNAECVVAPHGAALTNIVFCREHCKVINILPPSFIDSIIWTISSHLNLDYFYIIGEGDRKREFDDIWNDLSSSCNNIVLDIQKLKRVLKLASII